MKIDPYKSKERYLKWKKDVESGIPGISEFNSCLIKRYFSDMENGINISSVKKGSRSYMRLIALRTRVLFLVREFERRFKLEKITEITEEQLCSFFVDMRNGNITKSNGKNFIAIRDYICDFKAFWHWHQKVNRKKGTEILDITLDLDSRGGKPVWVYLNEEEVKKLCDNAKYEYAVLIWFLFDTGIRSPTELINVKVSDLYNDFRELQIREETSKTFGRKIKLLLCKEKLKEYIRNKNLQQDDYLFDICPTVVNRYLKRLAYRVFGDKLSPAGERYSKLTMYDFRHISCCYWLPRYKSESALKYRFGWKKSDKIHYYSELLGMSDTIREEDLLVDVTKTEIEKKLLQSEKKNEILQERMDTMEKTLKELSEFIKIANMKSDILEKQYEKARI